MIQFRCAGCGTPLLVDDSLAGKHGKCRTCGQQIQVSASPPPLPATKRADASRPRAPQNCGIVENQPRDHVVRNFAIVGSVVTALVVTFIAYPYCARRISEARNRDDWEINNRDRVMRALEEADRLQEADLVRAWLTYDNVLTEAQQHKITDEDLKKRLAAAETSRNALYPKVKERSRQEAEEQRRREEEQRERAERVALEQPPSLNSVDLARKWYEGGTLHKKTGLEWQTASRADKLATYADFVTVAWRNGDLKPSIADSISTIDDVLPYAYGLACFLDAAFKPHPDPERNRCMFSNQTVSYFAAAGMITMDWTKHTPGDP
ncbi:MAG: hypothetical protein NTW96_26105 [Planctomycetia bacterium]|nr:hypothetical protein [Planctomycetia bacterium]